MQSIIKGVLFTVLLGFFTVGVAEQLSPKIMVDKYLVLAEQLHAAGRYQEALSVMKDSIWEKKGNLTLISPDEFHYHYARVALLAGSLGLADTLANEYLSKTEIKEEIYNDTLVLLVEIERQNEIKDMKYWNRAADFFFWLVAPFGRLANFVKKFWVETFLVALIFVAPISLLVIWGILKMPPKYKKMKVALGVLSVVAGGSSIAISADSYTDHYSIQNVFKGHITNTYIQADSLALKDIQKNIKMTKDTIGNIKILLAALPDTSVSKSMRDSLLAQMDSLDYCIDKHFASTRRRLIRIEEKLERQPTTGTW